MERVRPIRMALALQGGGAHGAYGWGALQRILAEDVEIVAVSGASAGALNGAALVAGLVSGGKPAALDNLERLWAAVALRSPLGAFGVSWLAPLIAEPSVKSSLAFVTTFRSLLGPFIPVIRDMIALRGIVLTLATSAVTQPCAKQ